VLDLLLDSTNPRILFPRCFETPPTLTFRDSRKVLAGGRDADHPRDRKISFLCFFLRHPGNLR